MVNIVLPTSQIISLYVQEQVANMLLKLQRPVFWGQERAISNQKEGKKTTQIQIDVILSRIQYTTTKRSTNYPGNAYFNCDEDLNSPKGKMSNRQFCIEQCGGDCIKFQPVCKNIRYRKEITIVMKK